MNSFTKIVIALLVLVSFCFAAENAMQSTELRRAEIYIDEDLYKESDVVEAVRKYVSAVEKNFNFKIDIKSFPVALVLDSSTLNGTPSFKMKTSAAELKAAIKKSWEDKSKAPLAGVILIGNLPFAEMEYFVRDSDGHAGYPEDEGPFKNYQRWVTDYYFMDLDGVWADEITGIGCVMGDSCVRLERGANGLLDAHYEKNGTLGSDDFEIWVSRVNPYGEAREQTSALWKQQLQNYDTEYFPKVKEFVLHWLDKAYKQQMNSAPRSKKMLYTYSTRFQVKESSNSMVRFMKFISKLTDADIIYEASSEKYWEYATQNYDWVSHIGHGSEKRFASGVAIKDLETPVKVIPRVFDINSCSTARFVKKDGKSYDRTIALAHLFRTLDGGVSVISMTKTSGGYQENDYFYGLLDKDMLGDAFVKWVNYRTTSFKKGKFPKDAYEWFYMVMLFGDPFVKLNLDKENVKVDDMPKNIALHAFNDFNISGKCYDEFKGKDGKCNVVCGSTAKNYCAGVHGNAEIGSIYAKGGVTLRNNSFTEHATMYSTFEKSELRIDSSAQYGFVSYRDSLSWNAELDFREPLPEFPVSGCKDVTVDREYTPAVGSCIRNLTVKSSGTLVIPQGDFYVETVNMEKGSKYKFAKPGYYSAMNVKKGFAWDASPASAVADSAEWAKGFKLLVHGDSIAVDIDSAFYGSVYAPNTMVNVRGKAYGTFTGNGVAVHDKAIAYYAPFAPVDGEPGKVSIAFAGKRPHAFGKAGFGIVSFDRGVIDFEVDEAGMYNVSVLNALGQKEASFNVNAVAGRNTVKWAPARNARGRYVVRIASY